MPEENAPLLFLGTRSTKMVDDTRARPQPSRKRGRTEGNTTVPRQVTQRRADRGGRRRRTVLSLALLAIGQSDGARLSKQSMQTNETGGPSGDGVKEAGIGPDGTYNLEARYERILNLNEARAAADAAGMGNGADDWSEDAWSEDETAEGRSLQTVHSKTSSQSASASGRFETLDRLQLSKVESTSEVDSQRQDESTDGGPPDGAPDAANGGGSCRPATCEFVATYGLLPVHPSCRTYVLCQHGSLTHTFDCPEGTVFDTERNKCHGDGVCDCPDAEGEGDSGGESAGYELKLNYGTETKQPASYAGSFASSFASSGGGGSNSNSGGGSSTGSTNAAEPGSTNVIASGMVQTQSSLELASVCVSQGGFASLPLLSTNCVDYVECSEGEVAREMSCPTGLAFDLTIKGCNWIASVRSFSALFAFFCSRRLVSKIEISTCVWEISIFSLL